MDKNFPKIQMPGERMSRLRFNLYITIALPITLPTLLRYLLGDLLNNLVTNLLVSSQCLQSVQFTKSFHHHSKSDFSEVSEIWEFWQVEE